MDDFRKEQHKPIGPGGFRCACCNIFFGKFKQKLNRLVRKRMKREIKKEIERDIE